MGSNPTLVWKVFANGGAWTNTGDEATENEISLENVDYYPFTNEVNVAKSDKAIIDFQVDGIMNERLGLMSLRRGDSSMAHFIRIGYLKADGTIDTSKGVNGVALEVAMPLYVEPISENGVCIDKINFTTMNGVDSAFIVVDWNKITAGIQSISRNRELSPKCFTNISGILSKQGVYSLTPVGEEKVWSNKTYFPTLSWMKDFVVSLKLHTVAYGTSKNIVIQNLRVNNGVGRTFITVGIVNDISGKVSNITADQIALYDNIEWVEPIDQNGHKYQTLQLVERNSSGVVGTMVVDWAVVPRTSGEYDYYNNYLALNALLSRNVWSDTAIQLQGSIDITYNIEGITARLITSNEYNMNSIADHLIIYCHGNGQSTASGIPSPTALAWFKAHKISFAVIKIQDEVTPPFTTQATGWGNDIAYTRIVKLYEYLMANFNFHKSVVIAGGSMGGLTMGEIAYKRPFPIKFCLGIGPVPRLKNMWNVAARKPAIRAAYGMAQDSSDDANFDIITKGFDWYDMGMLSINAEKVKVGFPNVYLYYGNDATFVTEFGGVPQYEEIRDALLKSGIHSVVGTDGSLAHASPTLYDYAIEQGVFERELGIK